ncbi:maturation protein [ssRNA phage Esthiorhiza.3_9]|uniref:Maturation protein n=2 Tax=Leviviricetes TaxID=2842243 RepID=A0A8S5L1A5_9VIRU|nr:maturation protein [ssRNA phage Esthiorhiza.3_9]QDH87011.1 MAG: hypothetical protein H3RhizoLitter14741_000003 [Leviviridae sp.]DAD51425.1 TPA_asm: maturation protein [ssRNA phage Esthiorhiza.3_9]
MPTKTRQSYYDECVGHYYLQHKPGGDILYEENYHFKFLQTEEVRSEGHSWPPARGNRLDIGGDFVSRKARGYRHGIDISVAAAPPDYPGINRYYDGRFFPYTSGNPPALTSLLDVPSAGSMIVKGTTAIARSNPVSPQASLLVGATEIVRDGIPFRGTIGTRIANWQHLGSNLLDLFHRARSSPARLASELYLEYQFGFRPLVADIRDLIRNIQSLDKRIEQLRRDNDRVVRRRYRFPEERAQETIQYGPNVGAPILDTYFYVHPGQLEQTITDNKISYFSGAFLYHIPFNQDGSWEQHRAQGRALARIIFGVDLNISTVYQAAPWSWALDWVSNVGDTLQNVVSAQEDGLIMKYGYVMESREIQNLLTLSSIRFTWPETDFTTTQSFVRESKARVRATPFGFGLDLSTFTPRQWALISAIGISRSPNSLHF